MDRKEIIKWARHCANNGAKCEGCPYDGQDNYCRDVLLNDLATELEDSIPKAEFNGVIKAIERDTPVYTDEQYALRRTILDATAKANTRLKMIEEADSYFMTYNGTLHTAKEVIFSYEKETGFTAYDFQTVRAWFKEWTLCEISKEDITYSMLIKHGKRISAMQLYRANEGCSFSEANEAIKQIEATFCK